MTLRAKGGRMSAESVDDLVSWLRDMRDCPEVNRTEPARCPRSEHGDDPATWFYVEADAAAGVARLRCLGCGHAHALLGSEERWTFPPAWSCHNCAQSIAEVVYGLHVEAGDTVTWVAIGVRCVNCGGLGGATDIMVASMPVNEVLAAL